MAGDWIKMRCNIGTDPDVIEIASRINIDEFGVTGRLHAVWSWLDQHSIDGTNVRISSAFLDRLTACPGFADAMRAIGWLDGRDGALSFPGYLKHNGDSAKRRATETKRKQEQREREKNRDNRPNDGGTFVPKEAGLEKRREEYISSPPSARKKQPSVERLPEWFTPDLTTAWQEWLSHLAERDARPTRMTKQTWHLEIQRHGIAKAIEAIRFSISKGAKSILWDGPLNRPAQPRQAPPESLPPSRRQKQEPRESSLFPNGAPDGVKLNQW